VQPELDVLAMNWLAAGGGGGLLVAMMRRSDAARAHRAQRGEAAIELGLRRGKVVPSHAPGTDRQRDQKHKYFDQWREPGHGPVVATVVPDIVSVGCTPPRTAARIHHGQVCNRIAALKLDGPALERGGVQRSGGLEASGYGIWYSRR
jgi:hypothetical protein